MGNLDQYGMENYSEAGMDFEPLPAGWYCARIKEATVKATSSGTGVLLSCQFEIEDSSYKGRIVFHNFNLSNPNEKAVQIGLGTLRKCSRCAIGREASDTSELLDSHLMIKLSTEVNPGYADKNVVKDFKELEKKEKPKKTVSAEDDEDDSDVPF